MLVCEPVPRGEYGTVPALRLLSGGMYGGVVGAGVWPGASVEAV